MHKDRAATKRRPALGSLLLPVTGTGLALGAALRFAGLSSAAHLSWAVIAGIAAAVSSWWVLDAARRRRLGVDVLAVLSLVGTLVVAEYLAGAVIAVMVATGRSLEAWAAGRASAELRLLIDRTPRVAHRCDPEGQTDVPVGALKAGDVVLVKAGEVLPVDGRISSGVAILDESAITGEALPVEHPPGDNLASGTVNAGAPFELRASTDAAGSTYAGIVDIVRTAASEQAPAVRLADRYALWFLLFALLVAGVAAVVAGSLARAVAVLVVATPCPLILAVPVALVSGLSRAAQRGVVIKGGGALERLATARVLLFDKTGTLTEGRPRLVGVVTGPGDGDGNETLRLAASLDQVSPHVLATALVRAALARGLVLSTPTSVEEVPGQGIRGNVEDHTVAIGKASWVSRRDTDWLRTARRRADRTGYVSVSVALDGRPAAVLLLADEVRSDAARTIRRLRSDGVERVVMVTGDRADVGETVGAVIGVDQVLAERTPEEKVDAVLAARRAGTTIMVGDGINDAPALAVADVGIAVAARGATASSQAADVVLTVDRLDRVGDAVRIARRCRRIAVQSVTAGIGLSVLAMGVAAGGLLPATWGALSQEAIDLAVILNALRALMPTRTEAALRGEEAELSHRFSAEHQELRPHLEQLKAAADAIGVLPAADAIALARDVQHWLAVDLWPHERAEDQQLYPALARRLGGIDRTGTMSRAHAEIGHLIRQVGALLDDLAPAPDRSDGGEEESGTAELVELRRLLYGLHAVLRLHFAQEEESYFSIAEDELSGARR